MAGEHLIDIDRETGEFVQGWPRIRQSIYTILTTRLRTRLMRLWWGSEFMDMQDKPMNDETYINGISAAAHAINLYEPEFKVTRIAVTNQGPSGSATITVEGVDLVDQIGRRINVTL